MPSNSNLWQRIQGFNLDVTGDEYPFSARLGRENGWSHEQAAAAIEEYKKFIYLICVSPSPLTPSEVVDQVWHLHLLYTRSYWTGLCGDVLGRPIHHEPTRGGEAQASHFLDRYADTRSSYEHEFECTPPAEFWPLVSEHFAAAPRPQETNRKSCWIAPESSGLGNILWSVAAALFAALASCGTLAAEDRPGAAGGSSLTPMQASGYEPDQRGGTDEHEHRTQSGEARKHNSIGDVGAGRSDGDGGYWGCEG
jgi:hypothetical protein